MNIIATVATKKTGENQSVSYEDFGVLWNNIVVVIHEVTYDCLLSSINLYACRNCFFKKNSI